jgi:hypothetical protein
MGVWVEEHSGGRSGVNESGLDAGAVDDGERVTEATEL